jgi:HK97 family phage portal protein
MGFKDIIALLRRPRGTILKTVSSSSGGFYNWSGNIYQSDIIRSCIRPISEAVGKAIPKHIRQTADKFEINPEPYIKYLLSDPNPYMSGQMMQEKLIVALMLSNNAFAFINHDEYGYPIQIIPLSVISAEKKYDNSGKLSLKFSLKNGSTLTADYEDIIHLRRDYEGDDIFGNPMNQAILPLMDIVKTQDTGLIKAIKNSSILRYVLKMDGKLNFDKIEEKVTYFEKTFLNVSDSSGGEHAIVGVDSTMDFQEIVPHDYVPNAAITSQTLKRIYNIFSTNEYIVNGTWNEDQWNAYYESQIEPILIQLQNEYTRKLFSRRERGTGNSIIFDSSGLTTASMSSKLSLAGLVDRSILNPNEVRKAFNLPPRKGGDEFILRKDTGTIKEGDENAN